MANSVDLDQTAPVGAVCYGFTLFASILYSSVMFGNNLQQTTKQTAFSDAFFFLALKGLNSLCACESEKERVGCFAVTVFSMSCDC